MGSKTEKPTPKRLRDGAKKGQILKSRDFTVSCIILSGAAYLAFILDPERITAGLAEVIARNFDVKPHDYARELLLSAVLVVVPFVLTGIVVTALSTWIQTRLSLATEAVKINFDALNPVNGLKKLFSLRTVKELVKTILYLVVMTLAAWLFWTKYRGYIFIPLNREPSILLGLWAFLLFRLVLYCLGSIIFILILDFLFEYLLFMKDMRMDKEEVKRDFKEQEGSPQIKSQRRSLREEFLSEQLEADISNSRLIIANPSHIAIGIYFRPKISPIPLISVRETNQKALAVRRYAQKIGVPVIRDVPLARRLYATHRRYDFVSLDEIDAVLRLLIWLEEVEIAGTTGNEGEEEAEEQSGESSSADGQPAGEPGKSTGSAEESTAREDESE